MPILDPFVTPLQASTIDSIGDAIDQAVIDVINYLPTIIGAVLVLAVGYIIGRILGAIVARVIKAIGIGQYLSRSSEDDVSRTDEAAQRDSIAREDSIARALGKIVSYYVYFVAIVAAASILEISALSDLLTDLGEFLPTVLGALIVLILGFIVARIIGDIVADLVTGLRISPYLRETPLERFADTTGEFGRLVGTLITYYIYLLTLLAVADILEIDALSTLLNTFSGYLPALVGALIVLLVGIWVAERVGDLVSESDDSRLAHVAGIAVKVLIYYITVTIALSTIGFETVVLTTLFTTFTVAFFGALGLALAIGIGVAFGLGGHEYVAENIDDWMDELKKSASETDDDQPLK
jgi:low affinity Fe/Cu permease